MNRPPAPPAEASLRRFVILSVSAHVFFVLLFTVKAFFFDSEPLEYQSAVRVDLVALPDKLKPEAALPAAPTPAPPKPAAEKPVTPPAPEKTAEKPAVKPPPKQVVKDPDAINLDKTKSKQKDAFAKLKQMEAFEKLKAMEEAAKPAAPAAAAKPVKGNAISNGSQLTGLTRLAAEEYIGQVEKKIRGNWALPQYLARKNLSAQIRVKFDDQGNIVSAQITKSSGNPIFDDIVVDTINKSAPLPPPPDKFARLMYLEGILFGFPE